MKPFIKWAGGKTQLLPAIKERMPERFNRYVEPFVGGGALFMELEGLNRATISDTNSQLINCYTQIRDNLNELIIELDSLENGFNGSLTKSEYFYNIRKNFNDNILSNNLTVIDAAMFIFLNKSCFNGLYRVNSKGEYNAPFGKKIKVNLYDRDNLTAISKRLKNTKILRGDFESACKNLKAGDFVFFDSPYYQTFDSYQKERFSEEDHIRLAKLFKSLSDRGIYCMLTNSDTVFIKELYQEYNIDIVPVKRMINCDGKNRTGTEVIITNYNVRGNN